MINNEDLAQATNEGVVAGAGLDVLATEPPAADNTLFAAKNCYITSHISWATRSPRERLMELAVDNLKASLQGQPKNVVNEG